MRWEYRQGAWTSGELGCTELPLVQAVEARGALLEWCIDDPQGTRPRITVLDVKECDWLWELIGEPAHVAFVETVVSADRTVGFEIAAEWDDDVVATLRKLGHGQWLRDWWPTSVVDGMPELRDDSIIAEMLDVAVDVEGIVDEADVVRGCEIPVRPGDARDAARQGDYALAAGAPSACLAESPIYSGTSSQAWQGVPAHVIDSTENPVQWHVDAAPVPLLDVHVLLAGQHSHCEGLAVHVLRGDTELAQGYLDRAGNASLPLTLTAAEAWVEEWDDVDVVVGVPVEESREMRARVRDFARRRMSLDDALSFAEEHVDHY